MPRLVAVPAEPAEPFVHRLLEAWERGDAVLPVDPRLPPAARDALVQALRAGDDVEPGDALVVATSGTTGEPKGVVLTHDAVRASALATSAALGVDPATDRWLVCLPLAHVGGLGVVTRAVLTGTPLAFSPDDASATLVSLVPTQLERMDVSRFRAVLVGGSADWRAARPPNVIRTYGMTETGGGIVYDGCPLRDVDVRVSADGEVDVRGPMLLRAYRDGRDPKHAAGWLRTGDAGELGADGRLRVRGRMGDVIVTGGEKVWPEPVERALRTHPGVADVAVAGRADPEWGQRVVAWVVPADPSDPPTLDGLRALAKETLPPWQAPREVVVVSALPRTPLGKVRRGALG